MKRASNCIIYLVKDEPEHIANFKTSLLCLLKNAPNTVQDADLVIGVDSESVVSKLEIPEEFGVRFFLTNWGSNLLNQSLRPTHYPELHPFPKASESDDYRANGFGLGYRMMCRFFSGAMYFEYPILQDYEYYLRLDTDSRIESPIGESLFETMARRGGHYGFYAPANQLDNPFVTRGLHDWLRSYFCSQSKLLGVKFKLKVQRDAMYYTNFELGYFPAFRSPAYEKFFHAIDQSGGILINRWGDAPIKYAAVRTLFHRRNVIGFRNFDYTHGHKWTVKSNAYWVFRSAASILIRLRNSFRL